MLKYLTNIIGFAVSDKRRILDHNPQKDRKEVIKMAYRKNICGCGCILKQNSAKTTKDGKTAKKSK